MKKNKTFKLIASVLSALLIIAGIIIPNTPGFIMLLFGWTILFILGIIYWIKPSKKDTKLKLLTLIFMYLIALSWVIPATQISSGTSLQDLGLLRVSVFEAIEYPYLSFQFFLQPLLYILFVGGFYGVISETGKYRAMLDKIVKIMKGKETIFIILSTLILTILSSVFGLSVMLFFIIPPICGVILLMGYDRITAFLVGFVSTMIGVIGSTYAPTIVGYINDSTGSNFETEFFSKVILLLTSYVIYLTFTLKHAKACKENKHSEEESKEENEEREDEILLVGEKKQNRKPFWPILVVIFLIIALTSIGTFDWAGIFDISFFEDLHTNLWETEIFNNTIFKFLLDGQEGIGTWFFNEPTVLVLLGTIILSKVYNLKFSQALKSFGRGVKKVLKPAFLVIIAYSIVILTAYHPYIVTITDFMFNTVAEGMLNGLGNIGFLTNVMGTISDLTFAIFTSLNTVLSTILNIDMLYVVQATVPYVSSFYSDAINNLAIVTQSMYGLTLLFAPTSSMLLLGLEYLGVPYKEWLKSSWKLILELLAIIFIIILVVIFI